jgi:hypothetical protein
VLLRGRHNTHRPAFLNEARTSGEWRK